jgi:CBS domain containing-hemolysin-like protein
MSGIVVFSRIFSPFLSFLATYILKMQGGEETAMTGHDEEAGLMDDTIDEAENPE